jgi:hypothetical protein
MACPYHIQSIDQTKVEISRDGPRVQVMNGAASINPLEPIASSARLILQTPSGVNLVSSQSSQLQNHPRKCSSSQHSLIMFWFDPTGNVGYGQN